MSGPLASAAELCEAVPHLHHYAAPPADFICQLHCRSGARHEWQSLVTCVHTLPAGLLRLFVVLDTNILLTRFWHAQKVLEVLAAAPRTLVEVAFVIPWVSQRPWSFLGDYGAIWFSLALLPSTLVWTTHGMCGSMGESVVMLVPGACEIYSARGVAVSFVI